jgi:hypothetical protein
MLHEVSGAEPAVSPAALATKEENNATADTTRKKS